MTDHQSTHGQDCWGWGPKHYECAVAEIERLREELSKMRAEVERLSSYYKNGIDCFATPCEEHSGERAPPFDEFFEKYGGLCLICVVDNNEALQAENERLRKMHQDAYQRGLQAGSRGLREMYDAIQTVKHQDAWDNARLTEALMAAEERAERAEAENKRLRDAFENLASLRASDIEKEKDAFELWITSKHPGANLSPYQNNCGIISSTDYMHPKVQAAWDAWLARAALAKGEQQ